MKKRILIIDDDKLLNTINEKVLVTAGLAKELHFALNGKSALSYLSTRIEKGDPLPDIIILDLNMPVMDGLTFLDHYNELNFPGKSNIELVVFTSSTSAKDRQRALHKGVQHFLNKPYLLRGLTDIMQRLPSSYH